MSGVASLPRIVTIHDFTIQKASTSNKGQKDELILEAEAKTYRYLDEKELAKLSGKK